MATNMVTDWRGNLIWADGNGRIAQMGTVPAQSSNLSFTTKDFDFGQPSQRKKIYKVYITYRRPTNQGELELRYAINGGNVFAIISQSFPAHETMATESYPVDTITDFEVSHVFSMRLNIRCWGNTNGLEVTDKDFEINDMSIVFRTKQII